MTVYDSYTILNPAPGKYEADHPLVIGVNQSRVKTTINVPDIFAAGRYYFRGVNTIISGVVASDAGKPAYIEANLQDGEIGAGTLTLLSVHGVEANFPYSIKRVPLFETEIDASEIDTSGLVTKDTFNSTVARIDADIQKGDTDLRLDLDALTSRFTQLSSEVNAELDTFDESLGQIETEVKNLASEVDGYDARITNAENAASSANTVAQAASSAASAAQNTANEAKTEIAPLDAKVTQLETDVETAEVTANTAKTTADEAKTNADDAIQRAINARLEANKANDAVKLVQADLDKLEETVSTGSSDLTALTGRVTTAEGKITTLEGKATTAEADISAVKTTTAHLTDNLNQLTTSVTETKGVVDGLEVKVIDLRAEAMTSTASQPASKKSSGDFPVVRCTHVLSSSMSFPYGKIVTHFRWFVNGEFRYCITFSSACTSTATPSGTQWLSASFLLPCSPQKGSYRFRLSGISPSPSSTSSSLSGKVLLPESAELSRKPEIQLPAFYEFLPYILHTK